MHLVDDCEQCMFLGILPSQVLEWPKVTCCLLTSKFTPSKQNNSTEKAVIFLEEYETLNYILPDLRKALCSEKKISKIKHCGVIILCTYLGIVHWITRQKIRLDVACRIWIESVKGASEYIELFYFYKRARKCGIPFVTLVKPWLGTNSTTTRLKSCLCLACSPALFSFLQLTNGFCH